MLSASCLTRFRLALPRGWARVMRFLKRKTVLSLFHFLCVLGSVRGGRQMRIATKEDRCLRAETAGMAHFGLKRRPSEQSGRFSRPWLTEGSRQMSDIGVGGGYHRLGAMDTALGCICGGVYTKVTPEDLCERGRCREAPIRCVVECGSAGRVRVCCQVHLLLLCGIALRCM